MLLFISNEHSDSRFIFKVFAKNRLIKYVVEAHMNFFLENSSELGVFLPRRGLQANHGNFRKSAIFSQPGNQEWLK